MSIRMQKIYAWCVHLFTASGAVFGVLAILAATQAYSAKMHDPSQYIYYLKLSFFYIALTILIDAVDGTLARLVDIKKLAPFDGALLDNIIDFMTYAIIPAVWVYVADVVPDGYKSICIALIVLAACYQFCQTDAKTEDHFFKGFPSYWNLAIFYLIYFELGAAMNIAIIVILFISSFVPIKYVYPSRMDNVSRSKAIRRTILALTMIWGATTIYSVYVWPSSNIVITAIIASYCIFYFALSLYCTFRKPIKI